MHTALSMTAKFKKIAAGLKVTDFLRMKVTFCKCHFHTMKTQKQVKIPKKFWQRIKPDEFTDV